ncbi:MAG: hypothetical protein IPK75_08925 [Acidobacteria bacterium]|nr:hypothetical protein [Acidobacteriota bacterium]
MSRVYRFHGPVQDRVSPGLTLLRKRKHRETTQHHLIAADETTITDANGTRPIEAFRDMPERSYVTLTRREADNMALANPGVRPPAVLEDEYPWLPSRSYVPDSRIGFASLKEIQRKYGPTLEPAAAYCDRRWNTICNSLRQKSSLDSRFYFAWHVPIQDVFVLEERHANRRVIAIDINAMYPACMQEGFPNPSSLRHEVIDRAYMPGEQLSCGLYRCRLSGPNSSFIKDHNPFRTFFCGRRLRASLEESVDVDLNEFEVRYFARHFDHVYLVDAVIGDEVVSHPLAKEARRLFAKRQSYRSHGNKPLADREKFCATLLSSCSSRPERQTVRFSDNLEAIAFLKDSYGIAPLADEPHAATEQWMGRNRGVAVTHSLNGVEVSATLPDDRSSCFVLGQRIVARGRIMLLELMEKILALGEGIRICYVNIDSVHFSAPIESSDDIFEKLASQASNAMGSFKFEAYTHHGLWLEPGRYWLYSDRIERFRNRSIGDAANPFRDTSHYVVCRQIGDLHIPIRVSIRMAKSMSDLRSLDFDSDGPNGFVRQSLIERRHETKYSETLAIIEINRAKSIPLRIEAFERLKTLMGEPCPAASGQDSFQA